MYAIRFLHSMHLFGTVSVPFFRDLAGLTYSQLFFIQSWFTASWFMLEIPTGVVAEKFGRKASLFLGFASITIGALVMGMFPSFIPLLIAHTILGLGGALVSGADTAMLYESMKGMGKERRVSVLKRYEVSKNAGMVLGFLAGGPVAAISYPDSLAWTFIGSGILYSICTALTLMLRETGTGNEDNPLSLAIRGVFDLKKVWPSAIDKGLVSPLLFMIYWLYQPLLLSRGLLISAIGLIPVAMNLLSMALLRLFHPKSLRKGLLVSTLAASIFLLSLPFLPLYMAALSAITAAACTSFREPLLKDEIIARINERRAVVNSAVSMAYNISRALL